jgi:hypothetical protein
MKKRSGEIWSMRKLRWQKLGGGKRKPGYRPKRRLLVKTLTGINGTLQMKEV